MRGVVTVLLVGGFLCMQARPCHAQTEVPMPEWLEFVEEVKIPTDMLGGSIHGIRVSGRGHVSFTAGGKAWLFIPQKGLHELDIEGCRPGMNGHVFDVQFTPEGEILVGAMNHYAWFNFEGRCVHYRIGKDLYGPHSRPIPARGLIHAHEALGANRLEIVDVEGATLHSRTVDDHPLPNRSYRFEGGGMVVERDLFLWAQTASNTVAAYGKDLDRLWIRSFDLVGLEFAKTDLAIGQVREFNPLMVKEVLSYAWVSSLHRLSENTYGFVATQQDAGFSVIQVFDRQGNAVRQARFPKEHHVVGVNNGLLYARVPTDTGEVLLHVFRVNL